MSLWRQLTHGLRGLTRPAAADRDIADEVDHYLEEAAAALIARGVPPAEARRTVRLELGTPGSVSEEARVYGWERTVGVFLSDLRHAARQLKNSPGFTAVIALTLALGIGATTAIFSAVNPILFEPLPYPRADSVVMISDFGPGGAPQETTFGTFLELAERSRSLEAAAVSKPWQPTMAGDAEPERLTGQRVSAGYFRALGVAPILGRDFQPSDDRVDGPRVAILSDAIWRRRLGADTSIVGREVTLDDKAFQVIGVMPVRFENVLAPSVEVWAPLQYSTSLTPDGREWGHHLRMVARLEPGVGLERARRELDVIAHTPLPEFPRVPWASLQQGLVVNSLQHEVTRAVRPALVAVLGAVILVLAIACVNVTNLMLARGAQRRGEFAMRAALGAGRTRLTRQVLTESVLVALIGGALGMLVAEAGVHALVALSPPGLPRLGAIRVDATVFGFALVVTTLVGLLVGAVPALAASRADLQKALQQSSRRAAGGHQRTRGALVVAEVALALVLLVSAGLLLRSIEQLFAVDAGFDPARLLTMQIQGSGRRLDSDAARLRFFEQILERVGQLPGVDAAALTSQLPLSGDRDGYGVHLDAQHDLKDVSGALRYAVTPGYLDTMRIPLRRGRALDARDVAGAPRSALVSESLAKRLFPDRDPLGQPIQFGPEEGPPYTIVGVTGNVKQTSLAIETDDAVYVAMPQWHWVDSVMTIVIRARATDAASLTPAVRSAIWSVDRNQAIARVVTMDGLVARSEADRRFALILFEAFGIVALLLAATGIYGVLSGSVAERTREIGVRAALGASRADILSLVARQGMALTALGTLIGVAGAAVATEALVTMLFGVSRIDPVTYGAVVLLLALVSAGASAIPAWRAARVDPAITLRAE
jgi:putative ABC transport system permease protein